MPLIVALVVLPLSHISGGVLPQNGNILTEQKDYQKQERDLQ
jgi:hypothetical protein